MSEPDVGFPENYHESVEAWLSANDLEIAPWQRRYLRELHNDDEQVELGELSVPTYDAKTLMAILAGTVGLVALAAASGYISYALIQLLRVIR